MKAATILEAQIREKSGKGAARALRRAHKIPAILYGKGKEGIRIALDNKELTLAYHRSAFLSRLVEINLDGKTIRALPREVQLHPVSDVIEHADFLQVEKGEKIKVWVPVKFLNLDKSIGLKRGGVLNVVRHEIEFWCDPDRMPDQIEVDMADKDIGDSVHINDVKLPENIEAVIKRNFTVATVAGRMKEEEEIKPVAAAEGATVEGGEAAATVEGGAAAGAPGAAAPAGKDAGKKDAAAKKEGK